MANNFAVKDAAAASTTIKSTDTAGVHVTHHNIDVIAAGSNAIGKLAANSGVDIGDVDITSIAAGDNNIGNVDIVTLPAIPAGTNMIGAIKLRPDTANGLSVFKSLDLDESEEEVKGTAGQLYFYHLTNLHASALRYVKFYNDTAANVTVGTTVPVWTIPLRAGTSANVSFTHGVAFSAAITVAATTGFADNDTGAPGANEVIVNLGYL